MTPDNLILIEGGAFQDIKKALRQWIALYDDRLPPDMAFSLFKKGRGNHLILADKDLNNELFFFLVNYLAYPEGIGYKINIEGYTIGKEANSLYGKKLHVFLSPNDKDYDNVFVTSSENRTYKIDFGGKIIELDDPNVYSEPGNFSLDNLENITIHTQDIIGKTAKQERVADELDTRFRLISLILFGAVCFSWLLAFENAAYFMNMTLIIGFGITLWFYWDYKLLQSDRYFRFCLLISVVFLAYFIFTIPQIWSNANPLLFGALSPLCLLLIQKPTRLLFKSLLHREPEVDRPFPSFWDGIYMLFLSVATFVSLLTLVKSFF